MGNWTIENCTVEDAAALARNNGTAFWEEPMWKMMWPKDKSLEFIIESLAKILANRLISDRETTRHQKLVDLETGSLLGYSRWRFPEATTKWADAQVPNVDADQRQKIQEVAGSTWWEPREDLEPLDSKNNEVMEHILAEKPYIKLDYLAIHPVNQGKGFATALVKAGMREAERIGLPIFVFAYRAARNIYLRLGFTEVESVIQDDTAYGGCGEYAVYFMIYDISTKGTG